VPSPDRSHSAEYRVHPACVGACLIGFLTCCVSPTLAATATGISLDSGCLRTHPSTSNASVFGGFNPAEEIRRGILPPVTIFPLRLEAMVVSAFSTVFSLLHLQIAPTGAQTFGRHQSRLAG
jgi:hypothetical protein